MIEQIRKLGLIKQIENAVSLASYEVKSFNALSAKIGDFDKI